MPACATVVSVYLVCFNEVLAQLFSIHHNALISCLQQRNQRTSPTPTPTHTQRQHCTPRTLFVSGQEQQIFLPLFPRAGWQYHTSASTPNTTSRCKQTLAVAHLLGKIGRAHV